MLSAASSVLPGTELPEVAALNNDEQDAPPLEAAQALRALANVFSLLLETLRVDGMPAPGEAPVPAFTRPFAVRNALSIPIVLVQLAPTFPPLDMKDARAQTEAAVVTSLRTKLLPAVTEPQGPRAVMSQRDWFVEPVPGWPPFEMR